MTTAAGTMKNLHIDLPVTKELLETKILAKVKVEAKLTAIGDYYRIDEGAGFLSYIICVPLIWDRQLPELPSSVIVKALTALKFNELLDELNAGGPKLTEGQLETQEQISRMVHRNECLAYNLFDNQDLKFPVPTMYFAQEKTDDKPGVIVMENLVGKAGTVNIFDGLNYEQAAAMMDAIAGYQAFGMKLKDKIFGFDVFTKEMLEPMFAGFTNMFKTVQKEYPEEFAEFTDITPFLDYDAFFDIIQPQRKGFDYSPVFVHGDLWVNNILFEKKDGNFTNNVAAIIDWQVSHAGNPGEDISRLLASGLDGEFRRKHEEGLMDRYYNTLTQLIGRSPPFTREEVGKWYRKTFVCQAMVPVCIFPMLGPKMGCPEKVKPKMTTGRYALQDALKFIEMEKSSLKN